jgi:hypothetical protein
MADGQTSDELFERDIAARRFNQGVGVGPTDAALVGLSSTLRDFVRQQITSRQPVLFVEDKVVSSYCRLLSANEGCAAMFVETKVKPVPQQPPVARSTNDLRSNADRKESAFSVRSADKPPDGALLLVKHEQADEMRWVVFLKLASMGGSSGMKNPNSVLCLDPIEGMSPLCATAGCC